MSLVFFKTALKSFNLFFKIIPTVSTCRDTFLIAWYVPQDWNVGKLFLFKHKNIQTVKYEIYFKKINFDIVMDLAQHTLCNYLQDIDCNFLHTLLRTISISSLFLYSFLQINSSKRETLRLLCNRMLKKQCK